VSTSSDVLVVFADETRLFWLRLLRPGFRHCFAVVPDGGRWIAVEALSAGFVVAILPVPAGFDVAGWYRSRGFVVVPARRRPPGRSVWPGPFTCVALVKRVLGLRAPGVLTPWQLFRRLTRATA